MICIVCIYSMLCMSWCVIWNKMKSGVMDFDAYWLCRIATVHLLTLSDSFAGFVLATIV